VEGRAFAHRPAPSAMADRCYDLTEKLGGFLDRHMSLPLLDFLIAKGIYAPAELEQGKLEVLFSTNMVDLAVDIYTARKEKPPAAMLARREEVVASMNALSAEVQPILEIVQDAGRVNELKQERLFNITYLQQQHGITPHHVDVLHRYAKFVYDCGQYQQASSLLVSARALSTDPDKAFSAMWGKLASEILMQNWNQAVEDIQALRDAIEARPATPPLVLLQQRCWLMHWALFIFGNHTNGRQVVADIMFHDRYLNAVQTNAPHLLRYLAVAVVTTPRLKGRLKELVRVIGVERMNYSDPITRFLEALYTDCNFEVAQELLKECSTLLDNDFFLSNSEQDFMTHARLYIFETYCRIHERIDLKMLAKKLGMEQIAAEKWIVKMVSDAQLNAKIDSQSGHVILGVQPPDVYQQVIEKTKGLSFRSYVLAQNIEKRNLQASA